MSDIYDRWNTDAGERVHEELLEAFRFGCTREEMEALTSSLPWSDEHSGVDLRGIDLTHLLSIDCDDLRGVRLDGASLSGNLGSTNLAGASLAGIQGKNLDFSTCDLTGADLTGARIPGAMFVTAELERANLSGVQMRSGQLNESFCRGACLAGADLRLVWASFADLRNVDLTGADLGGASLGGARWNWHTKLRRARLTREGTPLMLQLFAHLQGAHIGSDGPIFARSWLEATIVMVGNDPECADVVDTLETIREDVDADPTFPWLNHVIRAHPELRGTLSQHARKAASNIGAILE